MSVWASVVGMSVWVSVVGTLVTFYDWYDCVASALGTLVTCLVVFFVTLGGRAVL